MHAAAGLCACCCVLLLCCVHAAAGLCACVCAAHRQSVVLDYGQRSAANMTHQQVPVYQKILRLIDPKNVNLAVHLIDFIYYNPGEDAGATLI